MNFNSADDSTPLTTAVIVGNSDIVSTLIDSGAEVNPKNEDSTTLLFMAKSSENKDIVDIIKNAKGQDVTELETTKKNIWKAAEEGDTDLVKLLLEHGENPNIKDEDGWFPLIYSAISGHVATAAL